MSVLMAGAMGEGSTSGATLRIFFFKLALGKPPTKGSVVPLSYDCRMNPETYTLTVRLRWADFQRVAAEAEMHEVNLSEYVRLKLGITRELPDDRFEDHERRLSRLEEMAGL